MLGLRHQHFLLDPLSARGGSWALEQVSRFIAFRFSLIFSLPCLTPSPGPAGGGLLTSAFLLASPSYHLEWKMLPSSGDIEAQEGAYPGAG